MPWAPHMFHAWQPPNFSTSSTSRPDRGFGPSGFVAEFVKFALGAGVATVREELEVTLDNVGIPSLQTGVPMMGAIDKEALADRIQR